MTLAGPGTADTVSVNRHDNSRNITETLASPNHIEP
jgi:hypothetical protein